MIDPFTGTGLTSSIITIVQVGYKISKRTAEFSRLLGDLPPDLQSCKDLVDILVRCAKRLQGEKPLVVGVNAIYGPPTELQADLEVLFTQCYESATTLFELLGGFEGAKPLSRAVKLARREGRIAQIRNRLDQNVLAILFILEEDQRKSDTETRYHFKTPPAFLLLVSLSSPPVPVIFCISANGRQRPGH